MGKSENYYFLITIAALDLKVVRVSIKSQGHSLTLVKGHSDLNVKTFFSQRQLGHLEPKLI